MAEFLPPQLVKDSRMMYFGWVPADPEAVKELVPQELKPLPNRQVFMNQYQVDREEDTSHFGIYSLTYLGVDVMNLDANEAVPARWWTHYINSSPDMNRYAAKTGVPVSDGETILEEKGGTLFATTLQNGREIIRTSVTYNGPSEDYVRAHLRYITRVGDILYSGRYPAIGRCAADLQFKSLEFLDSSHSVYALRPADPLEITWGFYFITAAFAYPGGFEPLTQQEIRDAMLK